MSNYLISVVNEQNEFPVNELKFEEIGAKMLNYVLNNQEIISLSELSEYDVSNITFNVDILICDDKKIQELNLQYRGKDKPTDVLSFALFADSPDNRIVFEDTISLGDIVISAQTTKKQADENEKSFDEEIAFLLSHGLLHLLGFDHTTEDELKFMLKIQDEMIEFAVY